MSFDRRKLSRGALFGTLTALALVVTGSCGFPDHTFVSDDEFNGKGKAGAAHAGGGDGTDASASGNGGGGGGGTAGNGAGATAGASGTGAAPGDSGPGNGGQGGSIGKTEGGPGSGGASAGGLGALDSGGADAAVDAGPPCDPGLTLCLGVCVDVRGDASHCGNCTTACTGGDVCKAGVCAPPCDPGLTVCSGLCVDTQTDPTHCGGCAKPPCASGYICKSGACVIDCGAFTSCVPGQCTDIATDDKHCGNCTTDCTKISRVCSGGVCQPSCSFPYILCNGSCVNPQNDDANCNGCNLACAANEACISSKCTKLVENCQNGTDDDKDGDVDCADSDCASFTCATTPAGWNGPVALWSGTSGTGPTCGASGGYPSAVLTANAGLVVPPYTCPTCSCAPSAGMYCDNLTFVFDTSTTCANTFPWNAQTITPSTIVGGRPTCQTFGLCCVTGKPPNTTARSAVLENPLASYAHGTCAPSQAPPQFPAASWSTDVIGCGGPASAGGGCGGGQCVPKPTAPFGAKVCIYRSGVATCPTGYPNQSPSPGTQYYQTVNDNPAQGGRSCSSCSCSASCGGTIKTYTDNTCTVNETQLDFTGATTCTTIPGDTSIQGSSDSRSYTFANAGPVCGSTPSSLNGAPQPDSPITVCCQ